MVKMSLLSGYMLTCWYPLLKSTEQKTTSSDANLFKMWLDQYKGVTIHFRLGVTLHRSITNLFVVFFWTKKALEQVLVG